MMVTDIISFVNAYFLNMCCLFSRNVLVIRGTWDLPSQAKSGPTTDPVSVTVALLDLA